MPAWVNTAKGSPAPSSGGGRQFYDTGQGAPSKMAPVYDGTPSDAGGGGAPATTPGSISVNPIDPVGTTQNAEQGIGGLLSGLKEAILGNGTQGSGLVSALPFLGDAVALDRATGGHGAQAFGAGVASVGDAVGQTVGGLGSIAERLPSDLLVPGMGALQDAQLNAQYDALPAEFKAPFQKQIDAEHGLFGTGLFDNDMHFKSAAIRAYAEDVARPDYHPGLFNAKFQPPGSLADTITNVMDLMGSGEQLVERGIAGADKVGGGNRLQDAISLGDKGTPVEQLAAAKFKNGDWSENEALDFLATHGAGFSHDSGLQLAATIFLDPLTWGTLGAAGVAKAGVTGANWVKAAREAAQTANDTRIALQEARTALEVAQAGGKAADIAAATDKVAALSERATTLENKARAFESFRGKTAPRGANLLARAVQSQTLGPTTAKALQFIGKGYIGLDGTLIGRTSKLVRTIIDPLHAIDLRLPGMARTVDLYSDALPRTLVDTLGPEHGRAIMQDLTDLDRTGTARTAFLNDIGTAVVNRGREGVGELYRAGQLNGGLGEKLMNSTIDGRKVLPDDVIDEASKALQERDLLRWLRYDAVKNVLGPARKLTQAGKETLARQLEAAYHIPNALAYVEKASVEQRALLMHAMYGHATAALGDAKAASKLAGMMALGDNPIDRLILLAKGTLTRVGADSLLSQLGTLKNNAEKARLIAEWQDKYSALRFISIDPANIGRSVESFTNWLGDHLDHLPMQVRHDELADLHPDLQNLQAGLGDGYSLGFAPRDEFKWGLERANDAGGDYAAVGAPWVGHVDVGNTTWAGALAPRLNLVGNPLIDVPMKGAAKVLDAMEAGFRTLKAQVSAAQITEVARQRFISEEVRGEFAAHGLTEQVAQAWWERIHKYVTERKGYAGPRGFAKGDLYDDLFRRDLIPHTLLNGSLRLTENDVMKMVMKAYDGDMRYIGLTQKLTGRAKRLLFETTGSNFAGQIAEHAWPTMKFLFNPIFQLQEKIEPWVLNAQRGISFATGDVANEADLATERLLQRMTDNSLIRQADLPDQAEYASQVLFGRGMQAAAAKTTTKMGQIKEMASALLDVQGVKRLNMLRTFRDGLGSELRSVWEKSQPGVWDDMKTTADALAGRVISDDEFAIQLLGEQLFANDIVIPRLARAGKFLPDFRNAIKTGAWHTPATLGELQPLDLDHVAASLGIAGEDGHTMTSLADLRRYVAADHSRVANVTDGLNRLGADKDYVQRVENALTFSWTGFWKTAEKRFGLTFEESRALQDMVAGAADLRGMKPADFLSQVFNPHIIDGEQGTLGELAKAKDLRAQLAGKEGLSTREDMVRQMSSVFSAYLDPSAKRALLMEFKPELRQAVMDGTIKMDLADLQEMWDAGAEGQLADRILGYMDGKLGTAPHEVITDATRGSAAMRKGVVGYLKDRGVTAQTERREYELNPQLAEDRAFEYEMFNTPEFERTGRTPSISSVRKAAIDLKAATGVDERTRAAYQDFVVDTQAQFDHLTKPTKKGGLGIKVTVTKTDPYAGDLAALQKDLEAGKLRVFGGESDHPLMTNEQIVQYRAVHDAFGHAAEGHGFDAQGLQNADAAHAIMYSDTGRAAMWTQSHAEALRAAEQAPVPTARITIDPKRPWESFTEQVGFEPSSGGYGALTAKLGGNTGQLDAATNKPIAGAREFATNQLIDDQIKALPLPDQHAILQQWADFLSEFPDMKLRHLGMPANLHDPIGSADGFGIPDLAHAVTYSMNGDGGIVLLSPRSFGPGNAARWTHEGQLHLQDVLSGDVPWAVGFGPKSVQTHEAMHIVDDTLRPEGPFAVENEYTILMNEFDASEEAGLLSRYGRTNTRERAAEMLALIFDPTIDHAEVPEAIEGWAQAIKKALLDMGVYKPLDGVGVKAAPKVGLLPQEVLDQLGEQFVGMGKHVDANPDVARTAQMFGKWTNRVIQNGLLNGAESTHAGLLHDIAGIPVDAAVPYNQTEALILAAAGQAMTNKWRDAFRLQYFQQERSMLERSINHPMFGLYPASYMWGKLGPEMVRFIAQKPFGIRTGGLAYLLSDANASIALQREYDPAFDAKINQLGHSQALSFLGYLLPTLPWDINASAPVWMKDIASQGLKNQQVVAAGGVEQPIDLLKPTTDTLNKLNPLSTTIPWATRAAGEVTQSSDKQDVGNILTEPVSATELGTPLAQIMQALREALSK